MNLKKLKKIFGKHTKSGSKMTMEEAKRIYLEANCYGFSIYDKYGEEKANAFYALNISKETRREWQKEKCQEWMKLLNTTRDWREVYMLDYTLCCWHNKEGLDMMLEALNKMELKSENDYYLMAKVIIGNTDIKVRGGWIFYAYDIGEKEVAKELAGKALSCLKIARNNGEKKEYVDFFLKELEKIIRELGIKL